MQFGTKLPEQFGAGFQPQLVDCEGDFSLDCVGLEIGEISRGHQHEALRGGNKELAVRTGEEVELEKHEQAAVEGVGRCKDGEQRNCRSLLDVLPP